MDRNLEPFSRPFNFRLAVGIPLLLMALLLLFEPMYFDFAVSKLFYSHESGFFWRNNYFFERILHHHGKQPAILLVWFAVVGILLSFFSKRFQPWRRHLFYLVFAMALSSTIVAELKAMTGIHCPWSLSDFGGKASYNSLLGKRAPTPKPGRCWPGGHASSGFTLLSLFFFFRDRRPHVAKVMLAVALTAGAVFSIGRVIQGAHFLSHNIWTFLICWLVCVWSYRLILYRPERESSSQVSL